MSIADARRAPETVLQVAVDRRVEVAHLRVDVAVQRMHVAIEAGPPRPAVIRVEVLHESWTLANGYTVRAVGPVITSTGKLHASHHLSQVWRSVQELPPVLAEHLRGPSALRTHLGEELVGLLFAASDDDRRGYPPPVDTSGAGPRRRAW